MGKAIRVVAAMGALVVCAASATVLLPSERRQLRESYKETNLGNGVFMVVVEVNGNTSYATARHYALKRASEVCGASGFVVGGADGNSYAPTRATTFSSATGTATVTSPTTATVQAQGTETTILSGGGHDFTLLYACNVAPIHQQGGGGAGDLPRH